MVNEENEIREAPAVQEKWIVDPGSAVGVALTKDASGKATPATLVGTPGEKDEKEKGADYLLTALESGLGYTPNVIRLDRGRRSLSAYGDGDGEGREGGESAEDEEQSSGVEDDGLPPVDRGKKAWSYLLGVFLAEIMIHGLPFSFGVFENYYISHAPFSGQKSIAIIGPVTTGLSYLCAPPIMQFMIHYPKWRRALMYIGLALCVLGALGASFAKSVAHLIITQGVIFGLGIGVAYYPMIGYLNEWFVRRRGLASGIMFAGDGVAGPVLPIIFEALLRKLGFRTTLRIWAGLMTLLLTIDMHFLIRARLPLPKPSQTSGSTPSTKPRVNLHIAKSPTFIFISLANLLQGLAYFIPLIYITTYATDLNASSIRSTTLLSLLNLSTVIGQLLSGHLSDIYGSCLPFFLSPLLSGLSVLLLWGFSKSFGPLVAFSLLYGAAAGGYSILYQRFALECAKDDSHTQLWIIGFLYFERGIGNVVSGPVSSALLGDEINLGAYAAGKYGKLVLFTGIVMCVGSISILGKLWRRK